LMQIVADPLGSYFLCNSASNEYARAVPTGARGMSSAKPRSLPDGADKCKSWRVAVQSRLEPIGEPCGYEVDRPIRRRLLQKCAREEMEIHCLDAHVPVDAPLNLRAGVAADVASSRSGAGFQQVARYSVNAVADALPPEEIRVRRQLQAACQVKVD
jgi:hypothetical protein